MNRYGTYPDLNAIDLSVPFIQDSNSVFYPDKNYKNDHPLRFNFTPHDLELINQGFEKYIEGIKHFPEMQKGPGALDYLSIVVGLVACAIIIYLVSEGQFFAGDNHLSSGFALGFVLVAVLKLLHTYCRNKNIDEMVHYLYLDFACRAAWPFMHYSPGNKPYYIPGELGRAHGDAVLSVAIKNSGLIFNKFGDTLLNGFGTHTQPLCETLSINQPYVARYRHTLESHRPKAS